jgi:dihydropteroate synthase
MAGISKKSIVIDPGFGFGKTTAHNLALLAQLARFTELGVPVLAGLSRKRTIGELTGRELPDRVYGSVAAALIAAQNGAMLIRVHDVAATIDALKVLVAVAAQPKPKGKPAGPAMPKWPDED